MSVEQFKEAEATLQLVIDLDRIEDCEYIATGHGNMVDLWESNQFALEVAAVVFGEKQK